MRVQPWSIRGVAHGQDTGGFLHQPILPHPFRPPIDALVELPTLPREPNPEGLERALRRRQKLVGTRERNAGSVVELQCSQDTLGIAVRIPSRGDRIDPLQLLVERFPPLPLQTCLQLLPDCPQQR